MLHELHRRKNSRSGARNLTWVTTVASLTFHAVFRSKPVRRLGASDWRGGESPWGRTLSPAILPQRYTINHPFSKAAVSQVHTCFSVPCFMIDTGAGTLQTIPLLLVHCLLQFPKFFSSLTVSFLSLLPCPGYISVTLAFTLAVTLGPIAALYFSL